MTAPHIHHPLRLRLPQLHGERASISVEGLVGSFLLLVWLMVSFEFYDAFRTRELVGTATYTVADLISRQSGGIGPTFVDGSKSIFDQMSHSEGDDQSWMRVTIITCSAAQNTDACDGDSKGFKLSHSYATGSHTALTQTTLDALQSNIPIMAVGDTAVIVETYYTYSPLFDIGDKSPTIFSQTWSGIGLSSTLTFSEFIVTRPRGAATVWVSTL